MKICVLTLGCKVNSYESDSIVYALEKKGHNVFSNLDFADVYIINTCAVTMEAEKKSRQMLAKCLKQNKNAKIVVCGCASQNNQKQFLINDNITYLTGVKNKMSVVENLLESMCDVKQHDDVYDDNFKSVQTRTRAYIKVQDGCNNFCSYCIIPYLRGRSRSRNLNSIHAEIENLNSATKEIVITGIDISDFKIDGENAFHILIESLKKFKNLRIRLGSLEQGVITKQFIDACKSANICPHFHLSLQSGCDETLERMNRKYKTENYLQTVKLIRNSFANANITTDIIVGFSEESEQEFEKTCQFVKQVGFSNLHIFPYSVRTGTAAEKLKQVDSAVKKERVLKLKQINENLNKNFIEKNIGKTFNVLVEEFKQNFSIGHSENFIKCFIEEKLEINTIYKCKIVKQFKDGVICTVCD